MYRNIKDATGKGGCTISECIRAKNSDVLMEQEQVLKRWTEYIEDLFHDTREEKPSIKKNMDELKILKSEVQTIINIMKTNKAKGPYEIVIKKIRRLEEFSIEKLTIITNEICENGKIPENLSKLIFIALPKRPEAIECEHNLIIKLINHVTKTLLKVLVMRARSRTRREIAKVQCGFIVDHGIRNDIFTV
ncbi:uncharacterized protein LOC106461491 [Limulus polyphemus]|uniref:Uncharacterized protein LOC106461491 n=1 Tax=Limulus polyphemus TaxID=6850 RepID=A0ABM1B860_LIMPO|nr:uncharacterized protein LOC106461491 [Limulus polyphemus]